MMYPTTYPKMTPTTKQITIRIPLPIMEAIARRCDQTGQDRSAAIVEALAAGLGVEPGRDRIDALEERVTALESKLAPSQTESRKVTRKVSRTESQAEPRESQNESQAEPRGLDRSEIPERTFSRHAKKAGMTTEQYGRSLGYQKQGKGNKAKWIKA